MNILITGGSRGIGRAICDKFTKEGHNVISPSRQELDLSGEIDKSYSKIDVLINNAGINTLESLLDLNNLEETMRINFYSPLKLVQQCIPYMQKQKYGRIINVGSIWVDLAKENRSSYSASKNALHSITKAITAEYASSNILANTISPGYILTDMTHKNNNEEQLAKIRSQIPIGRLGYAEEISDLVYFLTIKNTYITGQNIIIDGGYSCTAK